MSEWNFLRANLAVLFLSAGLSSAFAADSDCCLTLPPPPLSEADALVKVTWGPSPGNIGVAPQYSQFTIDILPGGGGSPTPPIPPARYAAWCFDISTDISTPPAGTLFGGYLLSSCDPDLNTYLPNHPNVKKDAATWKRINYLINHRFVACNGLVPNMFEVQQAIYILMGQTPHTSPPYPPFRAAVVQCLVDTATANAANWQLACGDKIAVIYNIDINWDEVAPQVQLIFLELPYCPPISCPTDVEIACVDSLDPAVNLNLGKPTTDECCPIETSYVDSLSSSNCPGNYVITRTWTAWTSCATNVCTQTITVKDSSVPEVTSVPAGADLGCNPAELPTDDSIRALVVAYDLCGEVVTNVTHVDVPNGCGITRTFTVVAVDQCGNASEPQSVVFTWKTDSEAPVLVGLPPATVSYQCLGDILPPPTVTALDNCEANLTVQFTESESGSDCDRTILRIWTVRDLCGNPASFTQTITVKDTTPPEISCSPNKTVDCDGAWSFDPPTATDNCGTATITVVSTVTTTNQCVITSTRTWKATDSCGNVAECSQTLTKDCDSVCIPGTFNFNGSSYTDGTDGNVRTYTTNGVSVRVTAFSRIKSTGAWSPAFLGTYSGGLGVTDSSEGSGSDNSHTVDNVGRDNFVLFEFSEPVVVNKATLGYVVTDSDFSLWIGSFADPYNNHLNLSDALLGSFGYSETNLTGSASARAAVINAGEVIGNAFVVAAWPGDTTPDDQFKISLLEFCKRSCTPPPPPCVATICGQVLRDCNGDGSLYGEEGLEGVTVKFRNSAGVLVDMVETDADGRYCSKGLAGGSYTVEVVPPAGYCQTYDPDSMKNNKTVVNLASCENKTGIKFGYTGIEPSVHLVKTGPTQAKVGETITYRFAVTNTGNTCLYGGMSIDDPMLGGVIWHQTPVVPGEGFVITKTYTVKSTDPKTLCNTATAIGHPPFGLPKVTDSSSWTMTITNSSLPKPACPTVTTGDCSVKLTCYGLPGWSSFKIKRSLTKGGPYTVIKSGLTSTTFTDTSCDNGKLYYYVVSCVVNGVESPDSDEACAIPSSTLPSPWQTRDIGAVGMTGSASYNWYTRRLSTIGSGADIWNGSDEFRYVYQQASGNCTIVARVTSVGNSDPWAKAGVMIRESLTTGAKHASVFVTPGNGVAAQYRETTGGSSGNANTTGLSAPYWVKVVRNYNTFSFYRSSDGWNWTNMGSKTIYMSSTVYIGLAVTSHNDGTPCAATFESVTAAP